MLLYVLKSTSCLVFFYLFYRFFLEKESMHLFKRIYLISTLFVSFLIPFITITIYSDVVDVYTPLSIKYMTNNESGYSFLSNVLTISMWVIYFVGVFLFCVRFVKNLMSIVLSIKKSQKIKTSSHTNVLLEDEAVPHTFLWYVFFNKSEYDNNNIPNEVLIHEKSHAIEMHSVDILIVEIFQIFFWFNPLIYMVKNCIKLNHEFLADQRVLSNGIGSYEYQKIILRFSTNKNQPILANSIKHANIKKRFTIMKTKTSRSKMWLKCLLALPLLAILTFSFGTTEKVVQRKSFMISSFDQNEATKAQVDEYNKLARYYNEKDKGSVIVRRTDVERLQYLYSLISESQLNEVETFPDFPAPPIFDSSEISKVFEFEDCDSDSGSSLLSPNPSKVIKGHNSNSRNIPPPPPRK